MGAPPRQRVRVAGARSGDGARTTRNEGKKPPIVVALVAEDSHLG